MKRLLLVLSSVFGLLLANPAPCRAATEPPDIGALAQPYPLQRHVVATRDGYLLSLFRLPHPPGSASSAGPNPRPAILLVHGLLDSCAGFLLQGPGRGLAFMLVDAGFQVWLANVRGSSQSRQHLWLDPSSPEFWDFSFDEMAAFDLPDSLAYVVAATGQRRIAFVSHSQGGTVALAGLAARVPGVVSALGPAVLLAPVASARHATSVPLQALAALGTDGVFALLGVHEFLPSSLIAAALEGALCVLQPALCINILAAIVGYRPNAVDPARLPLYLRYTPAGTSVKNIAHWAQNMRGSPTPGRPQLAAFDYGTDCGVLSTRRTCNQAKYGSRDPPVYPLAAVPSDVRLAVFSGGADRLADPLDIELMLEQLPAGVVAEHVHDPELEHLDYIWGADAPTRIYARVLEYLLNTSTRTAAAATYTAAGAAAATAVAL